MMTADGPGNVVPRPGPTGSILVADDHKANRQTLARLLSLLGHNVTVAENGRQALAQLRERSFDLVLLDVVMPEMDGVATLKQIKADASLQEMPVIMVSGLDEVASVVHCIEEGAEDYLTKPLDPIILTARINAWLEKKLLRDAERRRSEELERALRLLKTAQDRLVAHEKLASLGALTAGIAHEIRNPLNFITNFAHLAAELVRELRARLKDTGSETAELLADLEQNVAKIEEHGQRADHIVHGMLLHARSQPSQRQKTNLNTLVAESVNLAYHGLRGQDETFHVAVEMDLDRRLAPLEVSPQDLSRVVLNLMNNALYAANHKHRTAGPQFQPRVVVRTRDQGDAVELRFWDNGDGVPAEMLDKLFTPFFTMKPAGEGTGLGLSISYDIVVQMHKGALRAESEEGSHAEFIVTLPRNPNAPPSQSAR
ncbi:MAG TPA: response regulator [Gemmataceae bacterium]|jgi:signal transduction histidine kinase